MPKPKLMHGQCICFSGVLWHNGSEYKIDNGYFMVKSSPGRGGPRFLLTTKHRETLNQLGYDGYVTSWEGAWFYNLDAGAFLDDPQFKALGYA